MLLSALAALGLAVGCSSLTEPIIEPSPTASPTVPPITEEVVQLRTSTVALGAAVDRRAGEIPAESLERLEAIAGRQLDYVRTQVGWDGEFPAQEHRAIAADGRALHLVIETRRADGSPVLWNEIADAAFGEPLFDEVRSWIARLAEFEGEVFVTFDRLPETTTDRGTAEDFVAAWRRLRADLADRAPEIETIWVVSQNALAPGVADEWYPGDDVVDRIGADLRNAFGCAGGDEPWLTARETLSPLIAFGAQHPAKPLVVAEIATDEDDAEPRRKSDWFTELVDLLSTASFEQVRMVGFFDGEEADQPGCDWRVDSSPLSSEAFGALARAATLGGETAEPAVVSCPTRLRVPADLSDEALVDTNADGVADVAFGGSSAAVGVGDQGADGHDQRIVIRFPALPTVLAEGESVELRVRLVEQAPALDGAVAAAVLSDVSSFGLSAFDAPATVISETFITPSSPGGYLSLIHI